MTSLEGAVFASAKSTPGASAERSLVKIASDRSMQQTPVGLPELRHLP